MQTDWNDDPAAADADGTEAYFASLSTGERWFGFYSDADRDDIAEVRCRLVGALAGDLEPIPQIPHLHMEAIYAGGCCAVRVVSLPTGEHVLSIGIDGVIDEGVNLWRTMHQAQTGACIRGTGTCPPPGPWCAFRLEGGARHLDPDEIIELDYIAGCVGWAWLLMMDAVE